MTLFSKTPPGVVPHSHLSPHRSIASANEEQPSIIVFLTDDQGWDGLSAHGNTNLSTPNIDRIATEGMAFDRFYVSPICSPTRAEFMTGRCPRTGVKSANRGEERLDLDETTVFEDFRAAGYRTAFGKGTTACSRLSPQRPWH